MMTKFLREYLVLLLCAATTNVLSADLRTRIAVFDTGIVQNDKTRPWLCETGSYDATGYGLEDHQGHGTNVAGLIIKKLDVTKYCLVIIKFYDSDDNKSKRPGGITFYDALKALLASNAKFVNMSISGIDYYQAEFNVIKNLTDSDVKVMVAAGNESMDFKFYPCTRYPACYDIKKNFYVVGAKDGLFSNFNGPVKFFDLGVNQVGFGFTATGTSQSCANFTNKIVRGLVK